MTQVFPYIAVSEPELTDHSSEHISNVINNVGRLLSYPEPIGRQNNDSAVMEITAKELLLLLVGCLLHDVGNLVGRKGHQDNDLNVWRKSGPSYQMWEAADRRAISAVCRAHTGKSEGGSTDRIGELALTSHYFLGDVVRSCQLAALLRFADELAEGPQRTSKALERLKGYTAVSQPYHLYAASTHVTIDRAGARIALSYDIDLKKPTLYVRKRDRGKRLTEFLALVYGRVLKLEHERVYARHYAPQHAPFRETSVSIHFNADGDEVRMALKPITLNDFNANERHVGVLEKIDTAYQIATLSRMVLEEADKHGT